MRTRLALVVGLGLVIAGCGGTPANGTVNGTVGFAGGTPASGVSVALTGNTVLAATTNASGHYAFTKVPQGDYLLSADAPGTLERHLQMVVVVGKSAVTVPALTFTAVGTVSGTVVDSTGSPAEGAEVRVLGTDRAASTDATGKFTVDRVPTGSQKLMATFGAGADRVTGTAKVTVKRGAIATASLTLAAPPPPPPPPPPPAPGTVTGTVTYPLIADASTIAIVVHGSTATTKASSDGTFSLDLPPGTWRIEATAPEYPKQTLGRVRVMSGETVAVPPKVLSMYRPLPSFGSGGSWQRVRPRPEYLPTGNRIVAAYAGTTGTRLYVIDLDTLALHPIALVTGPANSWHGVLGPKGKQVAIQTGASLYVMSVDTGAVVGATVDVANPNDLLFALDGRSVMVLGSDGVDRMVIATGKMTKVSGSAPRVVSPDHVLIMTSSKGTSQTWAMVTASGVLPKVLDGIDQMISYTPPNVVGPSLALVARKDCGAAGTACPLVDLAPGATAPVPVTLPNGSSYEATTLYGSYDYVVGRYAILQDAAPGTPGDYLLDTETGKTVKVPLTGTMLQVSPDGSELAFIGSPTDAMYVGKATAPFAGNEVRGTNLRGTFVAGDTFVAFDDSTSAPRRLVFKGGAAPTVDTDYKVGSGTTWGALAAWDRPSTGKLAVQIGDTAAADLPFSSTGSPLFVDTPTDPATGAPMLVGAVSMLASPPVAYVIDGSSGQVRSYLGKGINGPFPGAFSGFAIDGEPVVFPADGGSPVPLDKAGAQGNPSDAIFIAPGKSVEFVTATNGSSAAWIGIVPGLVEPAP